MKYSKSLNIINNLLMKFKICLKFEGIKFLYDKYIYLIIIIVVNYY